MLVFEQFIRKEIVINVFHYSLRFNKKKCFLKLLEYCHDSSFSFLIFFFV